MGVSVLLLMPLRGFHLIHNEIKKPNQTKQIKLSFFIFLFLFIYINHTITQLSIDFDFSNDSILLSLQGNFLFF